MKQASRLLTSIGAIVAASIWAWGGAFAQPSEDLTAERSSQISLGVESDLVSRYLFRGTLCSEGAVSQTSLWISAVGFTGSVWTNYDFNAVGGTPSLNEVDLALTWSTSLGSWEIESSLQTYSYPRQPEIPWTAEVTLAATWNLPFVQPFMVQYLDVKEYPGSYFGELGVQTGVPLSGNIEWDATLSAGWASAKFNEAYLGGDVSAWQVAMFDTGIAWNPVVGLCLRPHFAAGAVLDAGVRDLVDDSTPIQLGLSVGGEF